MAQEETYKILDMNNGHYIASTLSYCSEGTLSSLYIKSLYRQAKSFHKVVAEVVFTTGNPRVQPQRTVPIPGQYPTQNLAGLPAILSLKAAKSVQEWVRYGQITVI
jgi:hypothetical protein